ncbi:zinc transport system substrate-binding protein [Knoellia remsis]|uniref:Zinc transport system substrate-binding protein n=1 Tax=Knoellia remsis TaxID=407159 RepID=A0A2T0V0P2_9MICO|nr:metal ABC transporter substrate-binding protein [Knoellia remsis]PRY63726.1 zinc transport system substrate-binding protein [Knoellia remsis]
MKLASLATVVAGLLALSACGSSTTDTAGDSAGRLAVSAAFYPLAYAVERVGGDHVTVTNLTRAGAEPHDLELTPKDVAGLHRADLVVYEKGFQAAVDAAVEGLEKEQTFDVTSEVDLTLDSAEEQGGDHEHHDHGGIDPHFWLDPTKYAEAVTAIGDRLAQTDAGNAPAYRQNAATFVAELTTLDNEFTAGLKNCASRELVTGHAAFGYLAARYDLHQEGISGLSPDVEPNAATMKAVVELIREQKVTTVYAEPLVSPELAETVARESGAVVEVLDPLEGITDTSRGRSYPEVMRANLATLVEGQGCR